jgi:hypothetical protein
MGRGVTPLAAVLFAVAIGCSSSGTSSGRPEAKGAEAGAIDAKKPRGWQGYSGKRTTGTEELGQAPEAELGGMDGKPVVLSSLWSGDKGLYLVFYRGDW